MKPDTMVSTIAFLGMSCSYSHQLFSHDRLRALCERDAPDWRWCLIDATVNDDQGMVLKRLLAAEPRVVAATLYLFNRDVVIRILKRFRRLRPEAVVALGGPEFLGDNEAFLRSNPQIDVVFRGDETAFPPFLDRLAAAAEWDGAPGACFIDSKGRRRDGGTVAFRGDLDELPVPRRVFDPDKPRPFVQIETSRGCGGRCRFCASALSNGVGVHSIARVRRELRELRVASVREIRLIDRTFNEDSDRCVRLLDLFREEFSDVRFHLEINPALLTETTLAALARAPKGRLHAEVGVQTFSPTAARIVNRRGDPKRTAVGLDALIALDGVETHADLIAGLPGQTFEDVLNDASTLIAKGPDEIQLETLKVLPGSPLATDPPPGLIWDPEPPYEVLSSETMTFAEIQRSRRLSVALDGFFNAPALRNAFRFACRRTGFLADFLTFHEEVEAELAKGSLKRRFALLEEWAGRVENEFLCELIRFAWLAAGLPEARYGLKTIGKGKSEGGFGVEKFVFACGEGRGAKRFVEATFAGAVAAAWSNPDDAVDRSGRRVYRFFKSGGNRIDAIGRMGAVT